MCTAISVTVHNNYFGRNLDFEKDFGEKILITPRQYSFEFTDNTVSHNHYAIIGIGIPMDGYPLYFDATNEMGLSIAGLNFPHYCQYNEFSSGKTNVASFEFIPRILSCCATVDEAEAFSENVNITNLSFKPELDPTPLHWIISDKNRSITAEQVVGGIKVYKNSLGVLTNSPPFDMQIVNLSNYMNLTPGEPQNRFCSNAELKVYSRGMGAIGLPGDLSSMSRFVRASFAKLNSVYGENEYETVNQFFHILYLVHQPKGMAQVGNEYEITNYTSCCNSDKGIYYYTTYNNFAINAVDMHREELNSSKLIVYDMIKHRQIPIGN